MTKTAVVIALIGLIVAALGLAGKFTFIIGGSALLVLGYFGGRYHRTLEARTMEPGRMLWE